MLWQFRFSLRSVLVAGSLFLANLPLAHSAQAQSLPTRERTLMAQSFTSEKLWEWQKRLNLDDWKISVVIVRTGDLKPKTLGNIHWDSDRKTATIRVLDPMDYKLKDQAMLDDMEFTVVHELIHLELAPVLSPLQRNEANRMEEEHAVNHMAQALLDLNHGK